VVRAALSKGYGTPHTLPAHELPHDEENQAP
jgi:hypothetical protein